jgi:hypothetical protein
VIALDVEWHFDIESAPGGNAVVRFCHQGTIDKCDMIRVVVAEDHHLINQKASVALGDGGDIQVVGEADTVEMRSLSRSLRPDVLVLDISIPEPDGLIR